MQRKLESIADQYGISKDIAADVITKIAAGLKDTSAQDVAQDLVSGGDLFGTAFGNELNPDAEENK